MCICAYIYNVHIYECICMCMCLKKLGCVFWGAEYKIAHWISFTALALC